MKLHEYQSKPLFAEYGIPVPRGIPVKSPNAAVDAAKELGGELWVVKAQVHAGGRGKAGGVKLARSREEVRAAAEEMLGKQLVTHQSGPEGLPVNVVYVESGSDIERELYRQPKLVELRDITQEDDKEREAAAHDLNRAAQGYGMKLPVGLAVLFCCSFASIAAGEDYPVLFTKQRNNNDNLYLAMPSGPVRKITDSSSKDSSPMLSPDGRYIVFASERVGWWKIWKLDLKDREFTQLTDASSAEYAPSWSPSGDRIVFVSSRDGNSEIYIMNSDGSNLFNLSNNDGNDSYPHWHSNNRIYYSRESGGTSQIVSDNPEGSDLQIHTTGDGEKLMPQLSPSGETLLFYSDMHGNFEIYTTPIGGGEVTRLTNNALLDIRARWSPDGERIVFERGDKRRDQHIFTMNRDGSRQERLTLHDYNYAPTFVLNCEYLCIEEEE